MVCTLGTLNTDCGKAFSLLRFFVAEGPRNEVPPRTVANSDKKYSQHRTRANVRSSNPACTPDHRPRPPPNLRPPSGLPNLQSIHRNLLDCTRLQVPLRNNRGISPVLNQLIKRPKHSIAQLRIRLREGDALGRCGERLDQSACRYSVQASLHTAMSHCPARPPAIRDCFNCMRADDVSSVPATVIAPCPPPRNSSHSTRPCPPGTKCCG